KYTVHSGEFSSSRNNKDCILSDASRISHGCNIYTTKDLDLLFGFIALKIDRNIHIKSIVSSNVALDIVESFENHSYQTMIADNIRIALNTDDRSMIRNITKPDEYYKSYLTNNLYFEIE
ncbi:adenosine deaminase, partial [Francisella tularensis subsp. holarctica]|nr:adenosine deaminase [Francisella tularensis subsp. holarctica]